MTRGDGKIDKVVSGCIIINKLIFRMCGTLGYFVSKKIMFTLPCRAEGTFYDGKDESTEIY